MPSSEVLYPWLIHSALVSLVVLAIGAAAVVACRQPVRRLRIIEVTLAGCLIAPWLGMMPGYPRLGVRWGTAAEPDRQEASLDNAVGRREGDSPIFAATSPVDGVASSTPRKSGQSPANAHQAPEPSLDVATLLVAVYALGASLGLAWWLVGVVGLARIVSTSRPAPARCREILAELAGERADRVRLLVSARLRQPFASAWGRPVIVLPERLCGDEQALRCALAHEWTHVERHDFRAWTLAGIARVLFFYQPLVWWLRRQLRLGQDFLADAQAARQTPQPEDYAEFLTAWAAAGSLRPAPVGLAVVFSRSELYRRVVMLVENPVMESRAPRLWTLSVVSAAVVLVAAVAALSLAPPVAAEEKPNATEKPPAAEGQKTPSAVDPASAQIIEQIRKVWASRQERVKGARFAWIQNMVYTPREDTIDGGVFSSEMRSLPKFRASLSFEGEGMRYETVGLTFVGYPEGKPREMVSTFDGQTNYFFTPKGEFMPHDRGTLSGDNAFCDITTIHILPLMFVYRPLHPAILGPDLAGYKVRGTSAMIDGRKTVVIEENRIAVDVPGGGFSIWKTSQTVLWLDPARDYVPLRYTSNHDGRPGIQVDIRYKHDDKHGWIPASWKVVWLMGDGRSVLEGSDGELIEYALGVSFPEKHFQIDYPVGARVTDTRKGERELIKAADGSWQPYTGEAAGKP